MNFFKDFNIFPYIPREHAAEFERRRLATNVRRMYVFAIYVVTLQILLNVVNILKPADTRSSDIIIYVVLSMGTLALGIAYWILLGLAKKDKITSEAARRFLVESFLYIYLVVQLTFCTLNILSTGGVNSYIIAILMSGWSPSRRRARALSRSCPRSCMCCPPCT